MSPDYSSKQNEYPENVKIVSSIAEMMETDFDQDHNVLLLRRELSGNFNEVAQAVLSRSGVYRKTKFSAGVTKKYTPYECKEQGLCDLSQFFTWTRGLEVNDACSAALDQIRSDIEELKKFRFKSTIRVERENKQGMVHVDGGGNKKLHSRVLVNYVGAPTLGFAQNDILSGRVSLGRDIIFKDGAQPFIMQLGDIWRQCTVENHQSLPFVHSEPLGNDRPRILLVADPFGSDPN